jgi:hypothetical protein
LAIFFSLRLILNKYFTVNLNLEHEVQANMCGLNLKSTLFRSYSSRSFCVFWAQFQPFNFSLYKLQKKPVFFVYMINSFEFHKNMSIKYSLSLIFHSFIIYFNNCHLKKICTLQLIIGDTFPIQKFSWVDKLIENLN